MAGRLRGKGPDATTTVKFVQWNATDQVWNGAAFENWTDANIATYGATATQLGTSGWFKGDEATGAIYYALCLSPLTLPLTLFWEDTLVLPDAKAGTAGGLPTVDVNNNVNGLAQRTCTDGSVISTGGGATINREETIIGAQESIG